MTVPSLQLPSLQLPSLRMPSLRVQSLQLPSLRVPSLQLPLINMQFINVQQIVYSILLILIFYTWDNSLPLCMDIFLNPTGRLVWLGIFAAMLWYDINISLLMAVIYIVVSHNQNKLESFTESKKSLSQFDSLLTTIDNLSNIDTRMPVITDKENPSQVHSSQPHAHLEHQLQDLEKQTDAIHSPKVRELDRLINLDINALEAEFIHNTPPMNGNTSVVKEIDTTIHHPQNK